MAQGQASDARPGERQGGHTFLVDAERTGAELDALIADEDDVAIAAFTLADLLVGVALAKGKRRAATAIASDRIVITADARGFRDLPGLENRQHQTED